MYFNLRTLLFLLVLSFATITTSFANNSKLHARHHGKATFFYPGLGACGVTNTNNDFIAAIPAVIYDKFTRNNNPNNNSLCGKKIKVSHQGKVIYVVIADKCGGCSKNNIDLSFGAFQALDDPNKGVISVNWKIL